MMEHPALPARPEVVLFDLDGVLIDPRVGITHSVQHALRQFGIDIADPDELTPFIGPPLVDSFRARHGFSEEQARTAVRHYRERFGPIGSREYTIYPGIPELLAALAADHRVLLIASSKPEVFVRQIAEDAGFARYFAFLAGATFDHTRDAKSAVIGHALASVPEIRERSIVMIGDREHDVFGARAHGLPTIAVSWGYGERAELDAARPAAIADSPAELGRLLGLPAA